MTVTTTAPAFKAALKAALEGLDLEGVDVVWGRPDSRVGPTAIQLGRMRSDESAAAMGNMRREERYTLEVVVWVSGAFSADQQAQEERTFDVYAALSTLLRDNLLAGGALIGVVRTAEIGGWELDTEDGNESGTRWVVLTTSVVCRQRI